MNFYAATEFVAYRIESVDATRDWMMTEYPVRQGREMSIMASFDDGRSGSDGWVCRHNASRVPDPFLATMTNWSTHTDVYEYRSYDTYDRSK